LFVTTGERSYLHALYRGGRSRIEYVVRATEHLLGKTGSSPELWRRATTGVHDPIEVPARIALLSLHIQKQLIGDAMNAGGWGDAEHLTLEDIERDPLEACQKACRALDLDIAPRQLERTCAERLRRNAKAPEQHYSAREVADADERIERAYGSTIARALNWAADCGLENKAFAMLHAGHPRPRASAKLQAGEDNRAVLTD
jgi:hypothetical protein